jgi:DNA-binding response OmpR family regulator
MFGGRQTGLDLLRRIRSRPEWNTTAILVVSASLGVESQFLVTTNAEGLLLPHELTRDAIGETARGLLAYAKEARSRTLRVGMLRLNIESREASCGRSPLSLPACLFDLLLRLMSRPLEPVPYHDLVDVEEHLALGQVAHTVHRRMHRLRKRVGPRHAGLIENVPGFGYRLRVSERERRRLR